ncbi:hypothetical protein [Plantibacter sp. YIM 135347]|uniref:hypothetical protein n=1 Tax=Plantibacter sp. YIM 135347 TaxID=3423919 RepID=UPI003D3297EB
MSESHEASMGSAAPVLLIDGRSGSGKTSLAADIAASLRICTVVHMDDLYPGWDGLDEGSRLLVEAVLRPRAAGERAAWRRWDWHRSERAEEYVVDSVVPLIVEGCGALSRAATALSDTAYWLEAPAAMRERRLENRDGTVDWWPRWTALEDSFILRERPSESADAVFDGADPAETLLRNALDVLVTGSRGSRWAPWVLPCAS